MANLPWDREILNARERPLSSDINTAQSELDRSLREFLMQYFRAALPNSPLATTPVDLFIGEGMRVVPSSPAALSVVVKAGIGFQYLPGDVPAGIGGISGLDDLSPYKPLYLPSDVTISGITTGDATNARIDIIEMRMNRNATDSASRDVLDTSTGLFVPTLVNKTLSFSSAGSTGVVTAPASSTAAISYKVGIPAGSPAEPSVTSGYTKIATLKIPALTTSITRGNIIDMRYIAAPYGMSSYDLTCSIPTGGASPPTGVAYSAPPGVEMVVVKAGAANSRFKVYLLGGNILSGGGHWPGSMTGYILHDISTTEFYVLQAYGNFAGLVDSSIAADLAGSLAAPAAAYAIGTPYIACDFTVLRQSGGTTDATLPASIIPCIFGTLKRY